MLDIVVKALKTTTMAIQKRAEGFLNTVVEELQVNRIMEHHYLVGNLGYFSLRRKQQA